MHYSSYKQLKDNVVEHGDSVTFNVLDSSYTGLVCSSYIDMGGFENGFILDKLAISDKYEFCSKHYGYEIITGQWPSFRSYDFKALTKCLLAIYAYIELINRFPALYKEEEKGWFKKIVFIG